MSVDERGPKTAGPTGRARVGGWERKVDGGWMMSRLRSSWGPSKSKAVGAGGLWVGLAGESCGRGREGQPAAGSRGRPMWGRLARLMDALRSCQSGCQPSRYLPAYPPPGSSHLTGHLRRRPGQLLWGLHPNVRPVELVQRLPAGLLYTEKLLPGSAHEQGRRRGHRISLCFLIGVCLFSASYLSSLFQLNLKLLAAT